MSGKNEKLKIRIHGKSLPVNPFVSEMMRKTLLAMLSTLKGVQIVGDETVQVNVERAVQ